MANSRQASHMSGWILVALPRATHDVHVVHAGPLPAGMEEW